MDDHFYKNDGLGGPRRLKTWVKVAAVVAAIAIVLALAL